MYYVCANKNIKDMKTEKRRVLQVSESTAKKIDRLKALFLLQNDTKETADSIMERLADKALKEFDTNKNKD